VVEQLTLHQRVVNLQPHFAGDVTPEQRAAELAGRLALLRGCLSVVYNIGAVTIVNQLVAVFNSSRDSAGGTVQL
jgi:hypothetical protein